MNKKVILYAIAGAASAYLVYRFVMRGQSGSYAIAPGSSPSFSTQPSQLYPYQPNIPPRVDNSNQPWYTGDRSGMVSNGPNTQVAQIASYTAGIADIIKSSKSIWEDLGVSDWFVDGNPAQADYDA